MSAWRQVRRLTCFLLFGGPSLLVAQVPVGSEFQVNTYTAGYQSDPRVAFGPAGGFVVVWYSQPALFQTLDVFAQRYDAAGARLGAEFRVNTYTTGNQETPAIAVDGAGRFVVVWEDGFDGDGHGVFGQRFDASGTPLGAEFLVNTYTTDHQEGPAVAAAPSGAFLVSWAGRGGDGENGIFARRFSSSGQPQGAEFRVNSVITASAEQPSVGADAAGNFVVTWCETAQGSSSADVFARRFDGSGQARGMELRVNTFTQDGQMEAVVASSASGGFVVAWSSDYQDGDGVGVFAQSFDAAGQPLGSEQRVNTHTTNYQRLPSVSADAAGDFVVAWQSSGQDDSGYGVYAQRFGATGARRGAEFRVNTFTTGDQRVPAIGLSTFGDFVVAWSARNQDGSYVGVQAQRFGGLQPTALSMDGGGNSVWEPGESVEMKPTWRNVNGNPQTFTAGLSGMTGPPGPTYAIVDAAASYGTVANGNSSQCSDCYTVSVSDPAPRPALHWDAIVLESITPDVQGQVQRWTLHIGGSFTDVPTGNPFYRFVETLLHKGITGGCGGATYCPGNATTRDQMSVFVLLAKEGEGYAPRACGTPVFNDVPGSNPFCPFIEELSRRGVVSGCGNGNYCPGSPVTREQMAVFVLRTLDAALNPPACVSGSERFADVPASSGFCKWIEELARRQVVTGCGGGNYCPTASVTREQMGVFISATFSLNLYGF